MATPNPADELKRATADLQRKMSDLQQRARLTSARDAIEDLQVTLGGLPQRLAGLRTRGYVFEKDLEEQIAALQKQWESIGPDLRRQVERQAADLQAGLRELEPRVARAGAPAGTIVAALSLVRSAQSDVDVFEDRVEAAEQAIRGGYDRLAAQVSTLTRRLGEIDWMLKQLAEASFQLLPTESGIMAVRAVWCRSGEESKDDPQGVLFLTDQRLLFEQKQEVATKKVLFIATEKQKVQKLLLEAPVVLVESVGTSKRGLLKNEDHIAIRFASGAPVATANFHIWQPCEAWQALINRARTRDFEKDRAVALDQAEVEKVRKAPSQCPSCGGNITQPVLRGMDSIKCEYCGFVIRL